jgi:hypothetical protein
MGNSSKSIFVWESFWFQSQKICWKWSWFER